MPDDTISRDLTMPKDQSLSVRTEARIVNAELEYEAAKSGLEIVVALAAQAKKDFEELRRLTAPIKNLAPLIRDEVNSLERLWHHAEERKAKLASSVELANRELKSVHLAREQLTQIGVYSLPDPMLHTTIGPSLSHMAADGLADPA
jgi:hypothetical protein